MALTVLGANPVLRTWNLSLNSPTSDLLLVGSWESTDITHPFTYSVPIQLAFEEVVDITAASQKGQMNTFLAPYGYVLP